MRPHLTESERRIEERIAKATPGPWQEYGNGGEGWGEIHGADGSFICDAMCLTDEDAAFLVHAPTDLAALLDSLSLARSELAAVKVARDSRTHPGMTHHAGCYEQHHGCAIGEVERLRVALRDAGAVIRRDPERARYLIDCALDGREVPR